MTCYFTRDGRPQPLRLPSALRCLLLLRFLLLQHFSDTFCECIQVWQVWAHHNDELCHLQPRQPAPQVSARAQGDERVLPQQHIQPLDLRLLLLGVGEECVHVVDVPSTAAAAAACNCRLLLQLP